MNVLVTNLFCFKRKKESKEPTKEPTKKQNEK
jgi:hypothetical protein